jgi:hypothetical protein
LEENLNTMADAGHWAAMPERPGPRRAWPVNREDRGKGKGEGVKGEERAVRGRERDR